LEKIGVTIGDAFDAKIAEAIAEVESDKPAGTVVEVAVPGYQLNGKVIRPAKVKIATNSK